jgi:glycogen(starch) synthase
MRVLFWSGGFWPQIGGVEVLASKLLPELVRRGHEFVVVAPQSTLDLSRKDLYRGIPVYRFPFWKSHNDIDQVMEMRQRLGELKRAFAPHLVHRNTVGLSDFFCLLTAKVQPAPLLVTLHGQWHPLCDSLVARTLSAADWVVGCSASVLAAGQRLVPEITSRSSVIHNSLDVPALRPATLRFEGPQLLCLGRLVPEKGFDVALDALAALHDRFPSARLVIAGDGPARADLQQQASELGISDAVEFVGWVAPDQVPALINRATVVVIPSQQEAFSLVALEAALMARPVVATRVGGLTEVVLHQQTGLLVEEPTGPALAKAVMLLLDQPQAAMRMGWAGRRRAEQVFCWEEYVDAYDALYRRLATELRVGQA